MERTVSDAGREFARQLSRVGESVDNASLFSAFEAQSEESDGVFDDGEAAGKAAGKAAALAREASAAGASKTTKESEPKAAAGRHAKKHILLDKLNFTLGIFNLAFSCLWIGKAPQSFYIAYTVKSVLLLGARFSYYRKQNLHYYFFDFCYLVNALLLLHCWVPQLRCIKWLWEALFACCAGPLAWSIPALRNSLVLHDFEKTTSLFMHWSPVAVVWTLRWYPIEGHPMSMEETAQASIFEIVVPATLLYTTWCIAYYLKIFVVSEKKIQERGYDTLYSYMMRKGSLGQALHSFSPKLRPIIYLAGHATACTLAFLISWLFFQSFVAHTALILLVSFAATWNGACYYFDYFAYRYVPSLGLEHKPQKKKE